MPAADAPARVLSPDACWALLRTGVLGRLAVVVDGQPDIFPVNFVVDHGSVVVRTAAGTKLAAALDAAPIAFEVDGFEGRTGQVWSVVLKGRAELLRTVQELADTFALPLAPWHGSAKPFFLRIVPDELSGRSFVPAAQDRWQTAWSGLRTAPVE